MATWRGACFRVTHQALQPQRKGHATAPSPHLYKEQVLEDHLVALEWAQHKIFFSSEPLERTKDNGRRSWLAVRAFTMIAMEEEGSLPKSDDEAFRVMPQFLITAFEAAYPARHPNHKRLVTISFSKVITMGIGEQTYAQLTVELREMFRDLLSPDAPGGQLVSSSNSLHGVERQARSPTELRELMENPAFCSIFRAAREFDALKWMFEERQNILATLVKKFSVATGEMQPQVIRIRARRV